VLGKFEVLEYLRGLRSGGDEAYWSYVEIHRGVVLSGVGLSYVSVYRSVNALWCDGLLEASILGDVVRRSVRFRAKLLRGVQVSGVPGRYNIYENEQVRSGRGSPRVVSVGCGARGVGRG
jgi:hypothetical protein